MPEKKSKGRRRERKSVPRGRAYVQSTFNNTVITLTDPNGNVIAWGSAGSAGFKGSRKSTPFAAGVAAEQAARRAMEHGMRQVDVMVRGPGSGREHAAGVAAVAGLGRSAESPSDDDVAAGSHVSVRESPAPQRQHSVN